MYEIFVYKINNVYIRKRTNLKKKKKINTVTFYFFFCLLLYAQFDSTRPEELN